MPWIRQGRSPQILPESLKFEQPAQFYNENHGTLTRSAHGQFLGDPEGQYLFHEVKSNSRNGYRNWQCRKYWDGCRARAWTQMKDGIELVYVHQPGHTCLGYGHCKWPNNVSKKEIKKTATDRQCLPTNEKQFSFKNSNSWYIRWLYLYVLFLFLFWKGLKTDADSCAMLLAYLFYCPIKERKLWTKFKICCCVLTMLNKNMVKTFIWCRW